MKPAHPSTSVARPFVEQGLGMGGMVEELITARKLLLDHLPATETPLSKRCVCPICHTQHATAAFKAQATICTAKTG